MGVFERVKLRTGASDDEDELVDEICIEAEEIYLMHRYPNAVNRPTQPAASEEGIVVLMAIDIYNKIGAEGQRSHSENGVSRTYSGDLVSKDILSMIVPYCGVVT